MSIPGAFRNFSVVGRLGSWEAGPVLLGKDEKTGQSVRIKCLSSERAADDPALLPRFLRETMIYRQLDHPSITRFLTSGVQEDCHFMVLADHGGVSLADRRREAFGPESIEFSVKVARQIAAALEHAHSKGVVHRNIHPGTVLITPEGDALLTDFGVASTEDQLIQTGAGVRLGDHRYCSPEQNAGKPVTEASDLYALGLLLWELLTGIQALKGTFDTVVETQAKNRIPEPSSIRSRISPALDTLCRRLLQANPATRFASAAEVGRSLEGLELFAAV